MPQGIEYSQTEFYDRYCLNVPPNETVRSSALPRRIGCPQTGHRDADQIAFVLSAQLEGLCRDQSGVGGVKPPDTPRMSFGRPTANTGREGALNFEHSQHRRVSIGFFGKKGCGLIVRISPEAFWFAGNGIR